jgi:hypothetical protein
MTGILAVWNDIAAGDEEHYERWYDRQHLIERVTVPGFRCGHRYENVWGGDRRFFTFYEVDTVGVLASPAYMERLENPTEWTQRAMKSFRGMVRTVCAVCASAGNLVGSHAVVVRADQTMSPSPAAGELAAELAEQAGVARAQLWMAAVQQTRTDTREMKSRGPDALIAGAFVVECVRRGDADRIAARLARPPAELGISGPSVLGVYALLCAYIKPAAS